MPGNADQEIRLSGIPLSEGCAAARVCLFNETRHSNLPVYKVDGQGLQKEHRRFDRALTIVSSQLDSIRERVKKEMGKAEAEIFVAHKMILEDPVVGKKVHNLIDEQQMNAEAAVAHAMDSFENRLQKLENEDFRERATDIGEVKRRMLDILGNMQPSLQCAGSDHCQKGKSRIIVAEELTPAMTVDLDTVGILAFVTERGGKNSHGAILARALGVPAVSGIAGIRDMVGCGTELLVDGKTGQVVIWPTEDRIRDAGVCRTQAADGMVAVGPVAGFKVMANINMPDEVHEALAMQAEGIGLYRTEIEIIAAGRFLSEDELYARYSAVVKAMRGHTVIFRLYDMGSDKTMPFMEIPEEENPSLGWRGMRLLLGRPDVLRTQARALARASVHGPIDVLYPMVVDVAQFRAGRDAFIKAVHGIPAGEIRHGVLFEVPAACLAADELMREADFGSIGTNDLIQYLFAVDRDNERVAYDYHVDRPVFWNLLGLIAAAASAEGKSLSVCGELAGEPQQVGRLYDTGIRAVSVSARRIPAVRKAGAKKA